MKKVFFVSLVGMFLLAAGCFGAPRYKEDPFAGIDMNKLIEQDIKMLQHNFKRVVKVEKMADAKSRAPQSRPAAPPTSC